MYAQILNWLDKQIFGAPKITVGIILIATAFFATQIPGVRMLSEFRDLLPQGHPYIKLHNQIRDTFGGANNIIVSVEVDEGTIFTNETISLIHRLTIGVDSLPGVNHNLISSLTHRTTRKFWLDESGGLNSVPHYDATKGEYDPAEIEIMKNEVISNPRVYGLLVSPDLKAAIIKATLIEGQLDYEDTFHQLQEIRQKESAAGHSIYATGTPVLIGWVHTYVDQILIIFLYTVLIMLGLLVIYFRRMIGILLPIMGIVLTTIWGLGILSLLGYNLDPLMLVVPFLISARAMSHGIQLVERYYSELPITKDSKLAAKNTFNSLFRPGSLGVISDAVGLLLISLGTVPINDKLAHYASLWAFSVIFTVLIMIPATLAILPQPKVIKPKKDMKGWLSRILSKLIINKKGAQSVLVITVLLFVSGAYLSSWVQIGEAEPGSPLLYRDHDFNVSSTAINKKFPGSEELYVIARTEEPGGIKEPKIQNALASLQRFMLYDPELGGALGITDVVKQTNRLLNNDDPRWEQIPDSKSYISGLLFIFLSSSPVPDALKEFVDPSESIANMKFFYKDHKGETTRRAISRVKEWIDQEGSKVEGLSVELAGGIIGVTAAINEAAYSTNKLVIPAVLLLIFLFVTFFYWSLHAGLLMFIAMSFATTLTYAYMGITKIGINVNTVPIIAVGIGVGIDYSIYIMDRIREEMRLNNENTIVSAIQHSIRTTGVAIAFTATTLIGGVIMWVFISDLRFQADAALLLCVMLVLNACAAIFIVPSWIMIFKPKFIFDAGNIGVSSNKEKSIKDVILTIK